MSILYATVMAAQTYSFTSFLTCKVEQMCKNKKHFWKLYLNSLDVFRLMRIPNANFK